MALQSSNLRMVSLSSVGDAPPTNLQPPLKDGIHLRWAFDPPFGFPWHGYYLFRRPSRERPRRCLSRDLTNRRPGPIGSPQLPTSLATMTSDKPLVLTDDFLPAGRVELDLRNRRWLRATLPAGQLAARAYVTVGFRGRAERTCANLDRLEPMDVPNPFGVDEIELLALDEQGNPLPSGRITGPGPTGWNVGWTTHVRLPCPAADVRVTLQSFAELARVEAYDGGGGLVDMATMAVRGIGTLTLTGTGITRLTVIAPQVETQLLSVCWVCGGDEVAADVTLRTLLGGATLEQATVSGSAGEVRIVDLGADTIEAVEIGGSVDAAVIDICFVPVAAVVRGGWQPLPGFPQPLALPVDHGDYPCPNHPTSPAQAESMALGRIRYGSPAQWGGASFADLHDRLRALVEGGPPAATMYNRFEPVAGTPAPPPEVGGDIVHQQQRPLELVLLGSLHPAIAEMVGLAWVDDTAVPGKPYDYLIIADHDGSLGGSAASALAWLAAPNFSVVDGYLIMGRVLAPSPALEPPTDVHVYALPGGTVETSPGVVLDATNNAGLVWDRKLTGNVLAGDAAVLYHVWRADLGNGANPPPPPPSAFEPLTEKLPVPVGLPLPGSPTAPPAPQWPPFPMLYLDRAVAEGWYAYQVSGVDLFGRHSAGSAAAQWWQWTPRPDPAPWYYLNPPADLVVDPSRIRLLDKLPPPPPTGVEAFALDPDDPTVQRDAAWQSWWASLSPAEQTSLIGARVRWRWTPSLQHQAPDTREFRIYYQAAPVNSLRGRVGTVTPSGATQSIVTTDISNGHPAGTFDGLALRVGNQSFVIAHSEAGSPLTVKVDNIGPADEIRPQARARCSLAIPPGHSLYTDYGSAVQWGTRLLTVGYQQHVTVDGGTGTRRYEVFLPVPGSLDRSGLPLTTTLTEPIGYGLVGVTAADDKPHTPDVLGDAARFGNESRTGGPATVFRVRRVKPPVPAVPPDSEKVFASPADYHGRSYYTVRWLPSAPLRTHVFRALDHAVFRADAANRPRPALATNDPAFPAELVPAKRTAVAAELNALNALSPGSDAAMAAYAGLSNDGLRVLAALPGVDKAFVQVTADPLDPDEPEAGAPDGLRWRRVGPDVAVGSLPAGQRAYVDALDGRTRSRWFYRTGYTDEVGNAGPLGVSSPPVWLPLVVPPRQPLIARATGGERLITLAWASNREPDLVAYHIYRTDDPAAARDIRLMTQVAVASVPAGDPASRPATVSWSDDPVPGLTTFTYRVVAVDAEGNTSEPSRPVAGRAHDTALPVVPPLTAQWSVTSPPTAVALTWSSPDETLLELRTADSFAWGVLGDWRAPGAHAETHQLNGDLAWRFRLRARRSTGALRVGPTVPLDAL